MVMTIGNSQLVAAVVKAPPLLFRVPHFVRHPPNSFPAKSKYRTLVGRAPENAVGTRIVCIEFRVGDVNSALIQESQFRDSVDCEATQLCLAVVPCVQVPALSIMGHSLRRYGPFGAFVGAAR